MTAAIAFIFTVLLLWLLVHPFLYAEAETSVVPQSEEQLSLRDQKERCVQVIKDLELDFATGKVIESEYTETKRTLSLELSSLLEKIDGS